MPAFSEKQLISDSCLSTVITISRNRAACSLSDQLAELLFSFDCYFISEIFDLKNSLTPFQNLANSVVFKRQKIHSKSVKKMEKIFLLQIKSTPQLNPVICSVHGNCEDKASLRFRHIFKKFRYASLLQKKLSSIVCKASKAIEPCYIHTF